MRHTFARIVSEFTGDITATQNALDHQNRSTTRVYVQRIAVKRDPFKEYCGRHITDRPEPWYELYAQHQRLQKRNRITSPFMPLDQYREELARFITRYNSTEHERPTLGSIRTVPIKEYKRLYTTRYEIASETLALLLMKAEKRTIGKMAFNVSENIGPISTKR